MITAAQSKMARAELGWSVERLAQEARVGAATVARFETGKGEAIPATVAAMQRALEAAGIEFFPDNGVRLKAGAAPSKNSGSSIAGREGGTKPPPLTGPDKPVPRPRKMPEPKAAPARATDRSAQLRVLREKSMHGSHVR